MFCDHCREAGSMSVAKHGLKAIKAKHAKCPGRDHCYCQHKVTEKTADGSLAQVEGRKS